MTIKGSCLCGGVTFEISGEFKRFFICHCSYCRKGTGSAYAANLFTKKSALKWLSGHEHVKNFKLGETRHVRSFCSECGSALPNTTMEGETCMVPAGCLDDEVSIKPDAHIFVDSQASWEGELASAKRFPGFPE